MSIIYNVSSYALWGIGTFFMRDYNNPQNNYPKIRK